MRYYEINKRGFSMGTLTLKFVGVIQRLGHFRGDSLSASAAIQVA
jgi:hypothetical protein